MTMDRCINPLIRCSTDHYFTYHNSRKPCLFPCPFKFNYQMRRREICHRPPSMRIDAAISVIKCSQHRATVAYIRKSIAPITRKLNVMNVERTSQRPAIWRSISEYIRERRPFDVMYALTQCKVGFRIWPSFDMLDANSFDSLFSFVVMCIGVRQGVSTFGQSNRAQTNTFRREMRQMWYLWQDIFTFGQSYHSYAQAYIRKAIQM